MNTGAIAHYLHNAGIVDYRPTDVGGDCFIDVVPSSPDALVSVISLGGDVDPTTGETTTDFQIVVRGLRNDPAGPANRAQQITAAFSVLADAVPTVIAYGTDDETVALLVTPQAPSNSGSDELSRTEWIVRVTVRSTPAVEGLPDSSILETKSGAQSKADAAYLAALTAAAGHAGAAAAAVQQATIFTTQQITAHNGETTDVHGIADTSVLETQAGAQAKADAVQAAAIQSAQTEATNLVNAHEAETTGVHGIADTAALETQAGAQSKADAAQTAAEQTASADATSQIADHNAETEGVHGIPDTSTLETQAGSQSKADAAQTAAEATAAATYVPLTQKAAAEGVATLDQSGKIPSNQLPALAITESHVVADEAAMLALDAQVGDIAIRTDNSKSFILGATPATDVASWQELLTPPNEVVSVDGRVGAVDLSDRYAPASHPADTTNVHGIEDTARLVRDNAAVEFNPGDAGATPVTITTADGQSANAFLIRRHNGQSLLALSSSGYLTGGDIQASGGLRVGTAVTYNTGDRLISVENTPDAPTSNPSNGVIVYADGDRLVIRDDRGAGFVATEGYANTVAAEAQADAEATAAATYIPATEKAAADGVATLDANGVVPATQLPPLDYVPTSEKGAADGVATLDATGLVPSSQLPPSGGFLGDWQTGATYEPGVIVVDEGVLVTPRVSTSSKPMTKPDVSAMRNVTDPSEWTLVSTGFSVLETSALVPFVDFTQIGQNRNGTIYSTNTFSNIDKLVVEVGFYASGTADGVAFGLVDKDETPNSIGFDVPSNIAVLFDIYNDRLWFKNEFAGGTSTGIVNINEGVSLQGDGPDPRLQPVRFEFTETNGTVSVDIFIDGFKSKTGTYTGVNFPSGEFKLMVTGWSGGAAARLYAGDVKVTYEQVHPDWRRLADVKDLT